MSPCASCGLWVQYGVAHHCSTAGSTIWRWPQTQTYTWPFLTGSAMPSISAFKGAVKALKDLPAKAAQGDAYYVTSENVLVVRQNGGWFHFDKK